MSPFYPNEPFWSNHYHKTNPEIPKIHKIRHQVGETTQRQYSEKESPKRNPRFPPKNFRGIFPSKAATFCGHQIPVLGRSRVSHLGLPAPKPGSAASKPSMLLTFTGGLGLGPHPAGGRTNHPSERRVEIRKPIPIGSMGLEY